MPSFLKWKREILFLIPSIGGGGTSSLLLTNSGQKRGELHFKAKNTIDSFIQSVGENTKNFKPEELLQEVSNYSSMIPILTRGMAIQIAKKIFNGDLYKGTKYEKGIGKVYPRVLQAKKREIDSKIKNASKNKKRIKKLWTHDDRRYIEGLKDYVLSRIDEKNIQEYFFTKDNNHLFKGKNLKHFSDNKETKKDSSAISPLLGFLMGTWIKNFKAGYYVHQTIPYAQSFTETTKNLYEKKYKNIKLPAKPDYFFPDYDPLKKDQDNFFKEAIEDWRKGKSHFENWWSIYSTDRSSDIKSQTRIEWISPNNSSHKNIALRYLTEKLNDQVSGSSDQQNGKSNRLAAYWKALSSIVLRSWKKHDCSLTNNEESQRNGNSSMVSFSTFWGELLNNPLNVFCINNFGKTHPDFVMFSSDQHSKTDNQISSKIIFFRDSNGFNLLYPVNKKIIDAAKTEKPENDEEEPDKVESLIKNSELLKEFREYIQSNFPFLLLKYHEFIRQSDDKKKNNLKKCTCDEMIKKLVELIELGQKLKDWNSIWKSYDIRKINNSLLNSSTIGNNHYLNKIGTGNINPPKFLETQLKKDLSKLSQLEHEIKSYFSQTSKYISGNNSESGKLPPLFEAKTENNGNKYWVIKNSDTKEQELCMRVDVLNYLLESIITQKLINKFLKVPLIFETSKSLLSQSSSESKKVVSNSNNNSDLDSILTSEWKSYFNKNTDKKSNADKSFQELLIKSIKKLGVISHIPKMSDTTLHYLSKYNLEQQKSPSNGQKSTNFDEWRNIETFLTLTGLGSSTDQFHENLKTLITTLYLMENSFAEYKENIRKIIKSEGFGVYVFTLSWNKFCTVDNFLLDPIKKVEVDSFWTPRNNSFSEKKEEWSREFIDPRQCIKTSDRLSVASLKKVLSTASPAQLLLNFFVSIWEGMSTNRDLESESMMGFKGLISAHDISKLPDEFYHKIFNFLYREGYISWDEIQEQINNLRSNHQLTEYVKRLNNINSAIGKTFAFSDVRKRPATTDEAKDVDSMDWFNLTKRKELLIKFIKENILKQQKSLQETKVQQSNKTKFQGLLYEKDPHGQLKNKYIFNKDENSSIAYLVQITTDDLKDNSSFSQFVNKHLTPETLIQDIIKQAQNKTLQMKAMNNFLSRGSWLNDKKVFNLRTGDTLLKDQFSSIITV